MVKLRLTRMGRTHLPFYRIVAVDSKVRRDGAYIELLGTYEPFENKVNLKEEAIMKWLSVGAQPTDTVKNILREAKIWAKFAETKSSSAKSKKTTSKKPAAKTTKSAKK